MGRHCVGLLLDQIGGEAGSPRKASVAPVLVVRESTAAPAG